MNALGITFLVINVAFLLLLPRRWAFVPLLAGACYMTLGQEIAMGPFHFTVIRMLVAAGVVRIMVRGERWAGRMNALDRLMLVWAAWAVVSSIFHTDPSAALIYRLGLVYDSCGIYFLLRTFCQSLNDVVRLCSVTALLLIPIAVEMINEQLTNHNLFSALGGVWEPQIREGRIRSQGPFAHAILAGTVGAVSLPIIIGLRQWQRKRATIGIVACCIIVFTSASSGPMTSVLMAVGALFMWRWRYQMRLFKWLVLFIYIGLDLVMKAPPYYLIARFDLAGGSTGWHRARLIESSIEHLSEWWLAGTDYTRHWMPTGVSWNPDHTDITNHYLLFGVIGGLPLMLLFIAVLARGFSFVGQTLRQDSSLSPQTGFMVWALGASLFAHTMSFISVSYFDQSFVFIYLTLAAISSVYSTQVLFDSAKSSKQSSAPSLKQISMATP